MWNHLHITTKLSSSTRNLLDLFVLNMRNEDNLVYFCDGGMDFYLQYCAKNLQLDYSEKTIRNAVSELNRADLLLKARNNIYYINPLYFFKWSDKLDHRKLIKAIQEYTWRTLMSDNMREVYIKGKNEPESISD